MQLYLHTSPDIVCTENIYPTVILKNVRYISSKTDTKSKTDNLDFWPPRDAAL